MSDPLSPLQLGSARAHWVIALTASALLLALSWRAWRSAQTRWLGLALLAACSWPCLLVDLNLIFPNAAPIIGALGIGFTRPGLCWIPSLLGAVLLWRWGYFGTSNAKPGVAAPGDLTPGQFHGRGWWRDGAWLGSIQALGLLIAGFEVTHLDTRMTLVVAVDQSRSMQLVHDSHERIRRELQAALTSMRPGDRLGTVVFAANARLNTAPTPQPNAVLSWDTDLGVDNSDLERAIDKAVAELTSDAPGKVVLLTDGAATRGNALAAAARAHAVHVPVDVLALEQEPLPNVRLLTVTAPSSVAEGETFDLKFVIDAPASAELELLLSVDGRLVHKRTLRADSGQSVFSVRQIADSPGLHHFEVQLSSKDPALNLLTDDDRGGTFVRVRGRTLALVIDHGAFRSPVAAALTAAGAQVTSQSASAVPQTLAELSAYDLIVIEDEPVWAFAPGALQAIASLVRDSGTGLLLLGSPTTLGPGGYARSPLDAVSPVAFDLEQARQRGQVSLVIAIDASGSMAARVGAQTKLALANEAAIRSAKLLDPGDRLGVLHVDVTPRWTLNLGDPRSAQDWETLLRKGGPGGGGIAIDPALGAAYAALAGEPSAIRHTLLFADGNDVEHDERALTLVQNAQTHGITTSVVALGSGQDLSKLESLSQAGAGRFYIVEDPWQLPEIFSEETLTVSRAAINLTEFKAVAETGGDALRGIDFASSPALLGYVSTLAKPRAQVLLRARTPDPLLAVWSAGLGRAGVFTSDYARAWGKPWAQWAGATQLFAQLGRSLARNQDDAQLHLELRLKQGELAISADALDDQGALDMHRVLAARILSPTGQSDELTLRPRARGRYEASLPIERAGPYLVSVHDQSDGVLLAASGIDVTPLDEFNPAGADRVLLTQIAELTRGQMRDTLAGLFEDRLPATRSRTDLDLPLCWLAGVLFVIAVAGQRLGGRVERTADESAAAAVVFTDPRVRLPNPRARSATLPSEPLATAENDSARSGTLRNLVQLRQSRLDRERRR
ncbi:MAG TPA: VWA domain-containing protein [Polyangiaceae bacterium]|nr:VWA domain-containing protein [Polyangiaceae bacterium]